MSAAEWCIDCPFCHPRQQIAAPCGRIHDCAACALSRAETEAVKELDAEPKPWWA